MGPSRCRTCSRERTSRWMDSKHSCEPGWRRTYKVSPAHCIRLKNPWKCFLNTVYISLPSNRKDSEINASGNSAVVRLISFTAYFEDEVSRNKIKQNHWFSHQRNEPPVCLLLGRGFWFIKQLSNCCAKVYCPPIICLSFTWSVLIHEAA